MDLLSALSYSSVSPQFSWCCVITKAVFTVAASLNTLKAGPGVLSTYGVSEPSSRKGVLSISPHVIRGDSFTPMETVSHVSLMKKAENTLFVKVTRSIAIAQDAQSNEAPAQQDPKGKISPMHNLILISMGC